MKRVGCHEMTGMLRQGGFTVPYLKRSVEPRYLYFKRRVKRCRCIMVPSFQKGFKKCTDVHRYLYFKRGLKRSGPFSKRSCPFWSRDLFFGISKWVGGRVIHFFCSNTFLYVGYGVMYVDNNDLFLWDKYYFYIHAFNTNLHGCIFLWMSWKKEVSLPLYHIK